MGTKTHMSGYCVNQDSDEKTLHYIREKLATLEKQTLNEISVVSKKQNHGVPVQGLGSDTQRELQDLKMVRRINPTGPLSRTTYG